MNFMAFVPYSELELTILEYNGSPINEFYGTLNELHEYCGKDSDFTFIEIRGLEIELDDNHIMRFDDIEMN